MKINWKVRLKNPVFWANLAAAVVLPILAYLGLSWEDMTTWAGLGSALLEAVKNPVILVSVLVSVWNLINDPTTKGLSDKVIDRSMLITFPCPKELYGRNTNKLEKPQLTLSYARWESWKQSALHSEDDRIVDLLDKHKKKIEQINIEMSEMGRNLGHRVWQSIQNYILNYPLVIIAKGQGDMTDAVQQAFCDALAFKMMPKLRGLEVNGYNESHLGKIRQYLNEVASELSTDFEKACNMTSEIFQWNSAEFMGL